MLRKILTFALALVMIFSLAACGGGAAGNKNLNVDIDEEMFAGFLAKNITFEDIMSEVDDDSAEILYSLYGLSDADYDDLTVIMSTGATAEEIAVISVDNAAQVEKVTAALNERVSAQIKSYENYAPGEVDKLSDAVIRQVGDVVVLAVCNDYSEFESAVDAFLKGNFDD